MFITKLFKISFLKKKSLFGLLLKKTAKYPAPISTEPHLSLLLHSEMIPWRATQLLGCKLPCWKATKTTCHHTTLSPSDIYNIWLDSSGHSVWPPAMALPSRWPKLMRSSSITSCRTWRTSPSKNSQVVNLFSGSGYCFKIDFN